MVSVNSPAPQPPKPAQPAASSAATEKPASAPAPAATAPPAKDSAPPASSSAKTDSNPFQGLSILGNQNKATQVTPAPKSTDSNASGGTPAAGTQAGKI